MIERKKKRKGRKEEVREKKGCMIRNRKGNKNQGTRNRKREK